VVVRASLPLPLLQREFRLFFIGQATSTLGSSFTVVALVFAVLQTTGSVADVGLALAVTRLPLMVFVLFGGVVGDRLSRRAVMLASDAGRFVTQAIAAVLLISGHARFWELLVLFGLNGFAQAFFNPASVGLVPALVEDESLQSANALLDFARNGSATLGQLLGGALVTLASPGVAFAIDSGTFVVSAIALAMLRLPRSSMPVKRVGGVFSDLREGWGEFRSRTWLWVGTLHISLLNAFALVAFFALGPVVANRSLGGGIAWGLIGASFAVGMMVGSAVALRVRPKRPLLAAFAAILLAAPQLALLASAAPLAAVALAACLGGAQASFWGALWTTTMQREIPSNVLSRVAAYSQVGSLVLGPVGFAVVGFVAEAIGLSTTLWIGASWIVASTAIVISLPALRGYRVVPPSLLWLERSSRR
jgi:MFS family permease